MKTGTVYLVGAGPGDPGLITQRGLECLARADVVVYDHLIDDTLLDLAPSSAGRIYVGKSAGEHTLEQSKINRLLVTRAKEGKAVVRLKGGDPFVLGRGGEEAEALVEAGIPFEVVPGVTSAVAAPAYAGIPVTHRGLASSFAVITGHEDPGKPGSSINWAKLATAVDTLVFLMGMGHLSDIADKLMEHGRPASTSVAVIKDGTRPEQKTVVGTLKDIAEKVRGSGLGPPAVVVVGEVVGLRERLRWFDNRPLSGKRVLVTRARHQASGMSKLLVARGAVPIEMPAIEVCPASPEDIDRAILDLNRYHWLVLTSVNGVDVFFHRLSALGRDSRALSGLRIGAIGSATAAALRARGVVADYVPEVFTARGFLDGLKKRDVAGQRFLLPRADIADREMVDGIRALGAEAHEIATYRTTPATDSLSRAREMLAAGEIDVITFSSSSTVTNLLSAFKGKPPVVDGVLVACIGPKTAETARKAGLRVDILAAEQTIAGLVAAMEEYFRKRESAL